MARSNGFMHKKVLVTALVLIFMAILGQEANAVATPMSLLIDPNMTARSSQQHKQAPRSLVPKHIMARQSNDSDSSDTQNTNTTRAKGTQIYNNGTDASGTDPAANSTAAPLTSNGTDVSKQHALRQVYHEIKAMTKHNRTSSTTTGSVIISDINGTTVLLPSLSMDTIMTGRQIKKADIPRKYFCATSSKRSAAVDQHAHELQKATMLEYEEMAKSALANALLANNQTAATAAAAAANGTNSTVQDPASQAIGNSTQTQVPTAAAAADASQDYVKTSVDLTTSSAVSFAKLNTSSLEYLHKLRSSASLVIQEMMYSKRREIDVVWHVIHDEHKGQVSSKRIEEQMKVLNHAFGKTGFKFTLKKTTHTYQPVWFHGVAHGTVLQTAMKWALHKGNASTLNVYTVSLPDHQIGYSSFPWEYKNHHQNDGIVISHAATPGGAMHGYNKGKTLVHEVGHWLGLLHTYEGGCSTKGYGDGVRDTPPQKVPTDGCVAHKNTCPGKVGDDAVHNYMDSSSDGCSTQFTQGQVVRMHALAKHYREL